MIYLASPYTHPRVSIMEERYKQAMRALFWLSTTQIEPVYSPIVHWHNVAAMYDLPRDAEWWKQTNFAMIRRCQSMMILCVNGTRDSKGCREEYELAQYLMMPVSFINIRGEEESCPW